MKLKVYQTIIQDIKKFTGLTRDCAEMLIQKYPNVPQQSIHSILSVEVIYKIKSNRSYHYKRKYEYWDQYEKAKESGQAPGFMVRLAAATDLPPTFISRALLQCYLNIYDKDSDIKNTMYKYLKDPTIISDINLSYEIYLCNLYDDRNGFISDAFSLAIGYEYEVKLQEYLTERNIVFITEDKLRSRGYDKTPDIKLDIPIAVNGFIINWIESKARFGGPEIHEDYVNSQFSSYWNRFGPGLVIYWFDCIDEIIEQNDKRFIVMNHFPENIEYMNPDFNK